MAARRTTAAARKAAPAPVSAVAAEPAAILVADGEPLIRDLVAGLLTDRGYRVVTTSGEAEAVAALAADPTIALLIADTALVEGNGWALAVRAVAAQPALRVIYTSEGETSAAMDAGPAGRFLAKPYSLARLVIAVADTLAE
ncbi:response regulator [Sphingoaurantiacus capsulatus]|uniref:Response regulator n=1 Tax=Sphingoaurantiacus capsulatus TaxID=1771310 RepID=A0ABV7X7V3_9SPHN